MRMLTLGEVVDLAAKTNLIAVADAFAESDNEFIGLLEVIDAKSLDSTGWTGRISELENIVRRGSAVPERNASAVRMAMTIAGTRPAWLLGEVFRFTRDLTPERISIDPVTGHEVAILVRRSPASLATH